MAASSSGVGKISKGPQVFLNFRGEELYKGFIGHLEVALEEAGINVFIYKHERIGTKLQNLLDRIEQSRVALVILSKEYTTSVWCLDELVKIKECIDKGSLIGIPIFYKLEPSVVEYLEGHFGDNFRDLKRKNQHAPVKTQEWEEALTFISKIVGMPLSENSELPDREFIESIVQKVKSLLDDISLGEKEDQKLPKTNIEMAWKSLMNDENKILGLYGIGGVGKTTLLNRINNKFVEEENEFDVVIWVVVSKKNFQNKSIQDQILGRFLVDKECKQETENEKASLINNNLKRKKFVLLLDDIWSKVDLNKIGVPVPTRENGSKIVFTTRSEAVCNKMKADEQIKVDCLSPDEAWELFRITVGEFTLKSHEDIPKLAREVVEMCCGLPLALIVIGKALAGIEDVHEWYHAIDVLNSAGHEFPGMEERILPILKFSYDSLKDGVKLCFLYCSLFPEDFEIEKEKLIEYWICQGFINANRYEDGGTNQGYDILGLLVRAHLLIECERTPKVKMHDVIRGMALWVESYFGNQQETICVKSGAHVRLIPDDINWEIVGRVSLMDTAIKELSCSPNCPNLSTLLLPYNNLVDISVGFFRFMPQLVVLDLSENWSLTVLPEEISNLGSLKYLSLSHTRIKSLPVGLRKLRKLIYLNLEFTLVFDSLYGIATNLPNLQVLKLLDSCVYVDDILMEELQQLEHLKVLTVNIKDAMILERIQGVDRLARSIRGLRLQYMSAPLVILNTVALGGLQQLAIFDCSISEIKIEWKSKERRELSPVEILPSTTSPGFNHLSKVAIFNLKGQRDLSWLLFAQNLRVLLVLRSSEIEEIINKEKGMSITKLHPFENLEELMLYDLDGLTEVCWNYPNFPNCKKFFVEACPKIQALDRMASLFTQRY